MVPSSSAFISTTCLPCSIASSVTCARELDRAGDLDDRVDAAGRGTASSASSVTAGLPRAIAPVELRQRVATARTRPCPASL